MIEDGFTPRPAWGHNLSRFIQRVMFHDSSRRYPLDVKSMDPVAVMTLDDDFIEKPAELISTIVQSRLATTDFTQKHRFCG